MNDMKQRNTYNKNVWRMSEIYKEQGMARGIFPGTFPTTTNTEKLIGCVFVDS